MLVMRGSGIVLCVGRFRLMYSNQPPHPRPELLPPAIANMLNHRFPGYLCMVSSWVVFAWLTMGWTTAANALHVNADSNYQ